MYRVHTHPLCYRERERERERERVVYKCGCVHVYVCMSTCSQCSLGLSSQTPLTGHLES